MQRRGPKEAERDVVGKALDLPPLPLLATCTPTLLDNT